MVIHDDDIAVHFMQTFAVLFCAYQECHLSTKPWQRCENVLFP